MKINKFMLPLLALGLFACKTGRPELPNPDQAQISTRFLDKNTVVFENVTKSGYVSQWVFEGHGTSNQYKDTVFFGYAGTYKVQLTSNSKGGVTTTTTDVVITETSKYIAKPVIVGIAADKWHIIVEDQTPESTGSSWDFRNGEESTQKRDTIYLPFAGKHRVQLTSVTPYVTSTELSAEITIDQKDPAFNGCSDDIFNKLTGGCDDEDGKTWVVDPAGFMSYVGPGSNVSNTASVAYWRYPDGLTGDAFTKGMLDNEYTFTRYRQYIPKNGNVSMGGQFSDKFFGTSHVDFSNTNLGTNGTYNTYNHSDPKHKQASFIWKAGDTDYIKDKDPSRTTGVTIEIKNGSYLGWFSDNSKYYIVSITDDAMVIGHYYADETSTPKSDYNNGRQFTLRVKK